jgi:hypothetical protein
MVISAQGGPLNLQTRFRALGGRQFRFGEHRRSQIAAGGFDSVHFDYSLFLREMALPLVSGCPFHGAATKPGSLATD